MGPESIRRVTVVGPGRMGNFIALAYAFAGLQVDLVDLRERTPEAAAERRRASLAAIEAGLGFLIAEHVAPEDVRAPTLERITWRDAAGADTAFEAADLVLEAVAESAADKRPVFARIDRAVRPDCVINSTTSTMAADELAAMVSHPERYLNVHWVNPAHVSPLVELQPASATDPALVAAQRAQFEAMGKVPIVCGPAPGFLMPRLQVAVMAEAARLVEQGVASAEDVDRAMRWGLGIRYANMGVLEFADWGGTEILLRAGRYMARALNDERYAPPAIVEQMLAEDRQGIRTGRGFYDWHGRDVAAEQREVQHRIVDLLRKGERLPVYGALA